MVEADLVAPSTVIYRNENQRRTLKDLIDTVAFNSVEEQYTSFNKNTGKNSDNKEHGIKDSKITPDVENTGNKKKDQDVKKKVGTLTTFNGVFVPCVLNIWGVIMFLRLGWVVGQAGVYMSILIIVCSKVVTTVTALSLCAICTNGEVKGGGVYFLVSRALGPIYGGAIGILFFIAQAIATSMYVIGFAESFSGLLQDSGVGAITGSEINDIRLIGSITNILILGVSLVGIGWYAKCQIFLLLALVAAMISILIGSFFPNIPDSTANIEAGFVGYSFRNMKPAYTRDPNLPSVEPSFFTVFAIFFPAATGVMAGANLSGDLKNPNKSIPNGTLGAIGLTFVSYIGLVLALAFSCLRCSDSSENVDVFCINDGLDAYLPNTMIPNGGLLFNNLIMQSVSIWSPLFYVGVFGATLSSALASLVGAPRILQSVCQDQIFPFDWFNFFGKGVGKNDEPIRALLLSFFISFCCVLSGSLDVVAPLISNFFMVTYAFTNYACFACSVAQYPGWRPSFKYYNKWLSLFGFLICVIIMFMMDFITALVTVALAAGLYHYLKFLDPTVNWGAAGSARSYQLALSNLESLESYSKSAHVKTFRPQYLVMSGPPSEARNLIKFVSLLSKGGGLMVCGDVILNKDIRNKLDSKAISKNKEYINPAEGLSGFSRVFNEGVVTLEKIEQDTNEATPGSDVASFEEDDSRRESLSSLESSESSRLLRNNVTEAAHSELAFHLAQRLAIVKSRKKKGNQFLGHSKIWGKRKRCPGAFYNCVVSNTFLGGFETLLQTSGIGSMQPNTVVLSFDKDWKKKPLSQIKEYEQIIRISLSSGMGIMVLRDDLNQFDVNFKSKKGSAAENSAAIDRDDDDEIDDDDVGNDSPNSGNSDNNTKEGFVSKQQKKARLLRHAISSRLQPYSNNPLQGDTIDVWWIGDDGGLTMLVPYLLSQHRLFRSKFSLRVMTATNNSIDETRKVAKTEKRMLHLLNKFRINAKVEAVDTRVNYNVSKEMLNEFESISTIPLSELTQNEKKKTMNILNLIEVVRENTNINTTTIFMLLPLPETGIPVGLYSSWLEILSRNLPPMVMIRGNNESVLTFIS